MNSYQSHLFSPSFSYVTSLHLLVGKKAPSGFPSPPATDMCVNASRYPSDDLINEGFIRYSCQFRSGLDKIYFYFVVTNIALYLICAVTCPVFKKKKKENHVATDNQDAN